LYTKLVTEIQVTYTVRKKIDICRMSIV